MIKARNFIIRTKEIIIFMERHVNNCDLCIGRMESDRLLMMEYDFDLRDRGCDSFQKRHTRLLGSDHRRAICVHTFHICPVDHILHHQ